MRMYKGASWFCKFVSTFHEHLFHTNISPKSRLYWGLGGIKRLQWLGFVWHVDASNDHGFRRFDDNLFFQDYYLLYRLESTKPRYIQSIIHSVHIIHSAYAYTPRQFNMEPGNTWKRIIFPTSQPSFSGSVLDSPCFATGSRMMAEPWTKTWRLAVWHKNSLGGVMEEQYLHIFTL